jgi:DNA-binding transcriptional LysR family regulator
VELRHLRYFLAVADALNFTRAAARLRLTQPTLSRQIQDLETEVGTPLFVRRAGVVSLTPAGAHFLAGAKRILEEVEQLVDSTRAQAAQPTRLRIGYFGAFASELAAEPLRRFKRRQRDVTIELVDLPPGLLADRLDEGAIDLALLGHVTEGQRRRFAVKPIAAIPMLLALPAGLPEAKHRVVDLAALRGLGFIGYTEREFPERTALFQAACRSRGFEPRIVRRVDSLSSMLLAVGAGEGVGFGATYIKSLPHAGVVFSNVKPPGLSLTFHAAWRRDGSSPSLQQLVDLLPDHPA